MNKLPVSCTFCPGASVLKYIMSCGFTRLTKRHHGLPSSVSGRPLRRSHVTALPAIRSSNRYPPRVWATIALLISEHEYDVEPGLIAVSRSGRRCGWRLRGRRPHENGAAQRSRCGPRGCGQEFASVRALPSACCALVQSSHSVKGAMYEKSRTLKRYV